MIAVRGLPGDAAPRIAQVHRERDEKRGTFLKYSNRFFNVGVNTFKFALYKDLAKDIRHPAILVSRPTCRIPISRNWSPSAVSPTSAWAKLSGSGKNPSGSRTR